MSKYVINVMNQQQNIATSKAKDDVAYFLRSEGYSTIELPKFSGRIEKLLKTNNRITSNFKELQAGDIFLMQYPSYLGYRFERKLISYLKKRGVILIALVHDLDSIRLTDRRKQRTLSEEIFELNQMACVITSNSKMDTLLKDKGLSVPTVVLGIFDYQHDELINRSLKFEPKIVYAGNLNKAEFINDYPINGVQFDIYGNISKSKALPANIKYFGSYPATKIMNEFDGGFGLVWDGQSSHHIKGPFGEYLAYNNPHKLSLFLSSGMPVVIWRGAALASFVRDNNVGILVDSLDELPSVLTTVNEEQYKKMMLNSQKIAKKLVNGEYIKSAVTRAEKICN